MKKVTQFFCFNLMEHIPSDVSARCSAWPSSGKDGNYLGDSLIYRPYGRVCTWLLTIRQAQWYVCARHVAHSALRCLRL